MVVGIVGPAGGSSNSDFRNFFGTEVLLGGSIFFEEFFSAFPADFDDFDLEDTEEDSTSGIFGDFLLEDFSLFADFSFSLFWSLSFDLDEEEEEEEELFSLSPLDEDLDIGAVVVAEVKGAAGPDRFNGVPNSVSKEFFGLDFAF